MLLIKWMDAYPFPRMDKSPLEQKPNQTKVHWTISHWTKAHCLIWQGGQKPTSLKKNRFKSFIKQFTLIRLLLQGISHLQCVFTDIMYIFPVFCDKQLNLGPSVSLSPRGRSLFFWAQSFEFQHFWGFSES